MKTLVPWERALLLGILTTVVLVGCTPLWGLSQMGGPVDFLYLLFAVGLPALLLALFTVKTRTMIAAIVCGLLFSIPIATFCWILPTLDSQLDYFKNMRVGGVATIIGSIVLMILATFQRQLNQPRSEDDRNSAKEQ